MIVQFSPFLSRFSGIHKGSMNRYNNYETFHHHNHQIPLSINYKKKGRNALRIFIQSVFSANRHELDCNQWIRKQRKIKRSEKKKLFWNSKCFRKQMIDNFLFLSHFLCAIRYMVIISCKFSINCYRNHFKKKLLMRCRNERIDRFYLD